LEQVTLQINLSPGDIRYAHLTVPHLVRMHPFLEKRMLVVDLCRPQKTKIFAPDKKIPQHVFEERVEKLLEIVDQLKREIHFEQIFFLRPDLPEIKQLSRKYLNGLYQTTHAAGGTANMSYWAAMDLPSTRYVLHYDGDMLVHAHEGKNWVEKALEVLNRYPNHIIAVPRTAAPVMSHPEIISLHQGRPFQDHGDYWTDDWFSTRHFLMDREKLSKYLPLVRGRVKLELLARKWLKRTFPIDPEILLFKSVGGKGGRRMILKDQDVFMVHPAEKGDRFIDLLPSTIASMEKGVIPQGQQGQENFQIEAWERLLNEA
jgi:hypothetical protein